MSDESTNVQLETTSRFGPQWLDAQGQLEKEDAQGHPYIAKNKSQATYLSERGGALIVEMDGEWNYLIQQERLPLFEANIIHDSVVVESTKGREHTLNFDIEIKDAKAFIREVHYKVGTEDVSQLNTAEKLETPQTEPIVSEPMQESTPQEHFVNDEATESIASSEEENLELKEETKELVKKNDEVDEDEKLRKVQEKMREKAEAEEAKLQEQKQDEKEMNEVAETESREEIELEEEPEEDEMLLKVKALMQAKDKIDIGDIEFTGEDAPAQEEVVEEELEVQEQEEVEKEAEKPEKNEASLEGKIALENVDDTAVFKSLSYVEGFELAAGGSFIYTPHEIAHAYLSENSSQAYHVDVECEATDGRRLKGSIELRVTKKEEGFKLSFTQGEFLALEEEKIPESSEIYEEELPNISQGYVEEDTSEEEDFSHGGLRVVFDSLEEGASLHSDGTLGVSIILPAGAQSGEIVTINSIEFIINEAEAQAGQLLYSVYPDDEIEVSFTDSDNNTLDSVRAKANQKNIEALEFYHEPKLTGEVGSQSMHASVGEPSNTPWGIMNHDNTIQAYVQGDFGSLHIDAQTAEVEYKYKEHSGLDTYGTNADTRVNENFIIYFGDEPYADLEVCLHIQAQSIHGYSGHQIDSSSIEEMKLLKVSKAKRDTGEKEQMKEMLRSGLQSNKDKIAKVMMQIYEAKSKGEASNEAKDKLQELTDQKAHLEDKLQSLR